MPQLLPSSIFFYDISWVRPGGRLVLSIFFLTVGLLWVMLLMKRPAVKSLKTGAAIFVLGVGAGASMVILGKILEKTQLVRDTLVPNGFIIAWIAGICGLWTMIMAINASQLKLPVSKLQHVGLTFALMAAFYVVGGFVHSISILMAWLAIFTLLASISVYIWALPKRVKDGTWAEAIAGAMASFVLMTFIYAIIPHEWITFATSYLGFTADAKVSSGGQFVLNTWLEGNFWTKETRVIPFQVTFEALQDQATMAIYVIGATINIKLFSAWQKRNEPIPVKDEFQDADTKPSKLSRFGRPIKSLKATKA